MQLHPALLTLLLCLTTIVAADSSVVQLTEETFDRETSSGVWFIKFYAPWCGHCKNLAPLFDKLPEDSQIQAAEARVGRVDCTKERGICERFGVQSYPTLKVVAAGRFYDYASRREIPDMVKFVISGYKTEFSEPVLSMSEFIAQKQRALAEQAEAESASTVVTVTSASFDDVVKGSDGPWILKFYAPWCGHCKRLAPTWHRLSKTLQDSGSPTRVGKIDCTVHRRVCSRFGVNGYPSLFYVREGIVYKYSGGRSVNAFVEFDQSGWEKAESIGPIPDETFFSSLVDTAVEWAAENTVLAVLAGILLIAIFVAILVALLDYCLGADDVAAYRQLTREVPGPDARAPAKSKAE